MKTMLGKMWFWLPLVLIAGIAAHDSEPDIKYHGYVTPWSACEEISSTRSITEKLVFSPRLGIQLRQFMCRDNEGRQVENIYCYKAYHSIQTARTCVIPEDCQLGNVTDWLPYSDSEIVQYWEIIKLPHGGGTPCGEVETISKVVKVTGSHWITGAWSECLTYSYHNHAKKEDPYKQIANALKKYRKVYDKPWTKKDCGGGIKKRVVVCVDRHGKQLLESQCEYAAPSRVQPCEIPCPRDCKVDTWGEWGPCTPRSGLLEIHCEKSNNSFVYTDYIHEQMGVSIRERRVLQAPTDDGVPCPQLQEMRSCYNSFCPKWITKSWGDCKSEKHCGIGTRNRDIICALNGNEVESSRCDVLKRPSSIEDCHVPCSGDRVLSQWSPWSECSASCRRNSSLPPPKRRRYQYILSYDISDNSRNESAIASIDEEICNNHDCTTFSWLPMEWNPCRHFQYNSDRGIFKYGHVCFKESIRTRDVICIKNNEQIVDLTFCSSLVKPSEHSTCLILCKPDLCLSQNWTEPTPCPLGCDRYTSERRRLPLYPEVPNCSPSVTFEHCPLYPSCNNYEVRWYTGNWSSCVVPPEYRCGYGYKIRSVWCGSAQYEKLNPSFCAGKAMPETSIRCYNNDFCNTNEKEVISCNTICNDVLKYMDFYESQEHLCNCSNVELHHRYYSTCILNDEENCDKGYNVARSFCTYNDRRVPMDVCKKFHPERYTLYNDRFPEWSVKECKGQCPSECKYAQWGEWGPCRRFNNTRSAMRTRRRRTVYASKLSHDCSLVKQTSNCTDIRPQWKVGEWLPCSPKPNYCGKIIINRTVNCVNPLGVILPNSHCLDFDPMPETNMTCHAACPQDCLVSEWSEWSPCQMTSWGNNRRDRTRVILRERIPDLHGAECGHLVESRNCTPDTYNWYYGPWDDCVPLGTSDCGEGVKMRDARCIKNNKEFVDDIFCKDRGTKLSDMSWCYLDCGINCEVSSWSAWNRTACTCGWFDNNMMKRHRHVIVPHKWPGALCPDLIQRIPCPRIPCTNAMITTNKCIIMDDKDSQDNVQVCGAGSMTLTSVCKATSSGYALSYNMELPTGWCHKSPPGFVTSITPRQIDEECAIACKCNDNWPTLTPWSQWSQCNGFVRSRKRTLLPGDNDACHKTELQLSVQWTTCSIYETENGNEITTTDKHKDNPSWLYSLAFCVSAIFTTVFTIRYIIRCISIFRKTYYDKKPSAV